jgi:RNA ligase
MKLDRSIYDALVAEGWLSCQQHLSADLFIYNYTPKTQFTGHWTHETRMARGLIVDSQGTVVARPFKKFFNYAEVMPQPGTQIIEATEKMDGSLGILYRVDGQFSIATRGSFVSDQAVWANNWLDRDDHNLRSLDPNLTLLFEIIYPANRVVVDYGTFDGLILIGAIEMEHGRDYLYRELEVLADEHGFQLPRVYDMTDVHDYLNAAVALSANQEGWVLRYSDGERYKIKGGAYRLAHRLMTGLSFRRVLDAYRDGTYASLIEGVPDEFLTTVREYAEQIEDTLRETDTRVHEAFVLAPTGSRKDFARWVFANYPADQQYLFALLDGHTDLIPMIYKHAFKENADES